MTLNELKSQLKRFRIRPDKKLGQNFLVSEQVLDEIIAASELRKTDHVLEIGAGLGVLTRALAEQAGEVIAVEKDRQLVRVLRQIFRNNRNVKIIHEDALFLDPTVVARIRQPTETKQSTPTSSPPLSRGETGGEREGVTYKLVANLPYYITGAILEKFLTAEARPSLMVLLLQKEVAERVTAGPGAMSILSVSVQLYADPEVIDYVGKDNFYPVPEVDSAIVRLRVFPRPRFDVNELAFFQLIKVAFSNKRKQLHNNLQALPSKGPKSERTKEQYKEVLQSLGLSPLARAQDLSLQDWYRLYERLKNDPA